MSLWQHLANVEPTVSYCECVKHQQNTTYWDDWPLSPFTLKLEEWSALFQPPRTHKGFGLVGLWTHLRPRSLNWELKQQLESCAAGLQCRYYRTQHWPPEHGPVPLVTVSFRDNQSHFCSSRHVIFTACPQSFSNGHPAKLQPNSARHCFLSTTSSLSRWQCWPSCSNRMVFMKAKGSVGLGVGGGSNHDWTNNLCHRHGGHLSTGYVFLFCFGLVFWGSGGGGGV